MGAIPKSQTPQLAHSKIGASSMDRWQECPGSVALCEKIPAQTSVYAEEGTKAHDIAAQILMGKPAPKDADPEMMEAVTVYTDYVQNTFTTLKRHNLNKLMVEHRFDLSKIHPGLFGTADAVIYDGENKILHVVDYKHGQGVPVSPEDNPQLKYYALGALMSLSFPVSEVILTIVQPRYSVETAIKSTTLSAMDLMDFSDDLATFAKRTEDPKAPIKTGEWCKFCRAKPICPALREAAKIAVKKEFALDSLNVLPPAMVAELLGKLDLIEAWTKGVREFAYLEAKNGRVPPGYKLVPKRATRKWEDIEAATKILGKEIQSSTFMDCLTSPELKSPAQVEKILGKANKPLIDSLVVAISSGDTLVPEDDKREATNTKSIVERMFG